MCIISCTSHVGRVVGGDGGLLCCPKQPHKLHKQVNISIVFTATHTKTYIHIKWCSDVQHFISYLYIPQCDLYTHYDYVSAVLDFMRLHAVVWNNLRSIAGVQLWHTLHVLQVDIVFRNTSLSPLPGLYVCHNNICVVLYSDFRVFNVRASSANHSPHKCMRSEVLCFITWHTINAYYIYKMLQTRSRHSPVHN